MNYQDEELKCEYRDSRPNSFAREASMGAAGSLSQKRQPSVWTELEKQHKEIELLQERVQALLAKLGPVIAAQDCEAGGVALGTKSHDCELAANIAGKTESISAASYRLYQTIESIQL
ncbi:MAG: hypothetical protein WC322_02780 [Candidatus Paceibacterota bacterium]|jgi:hypothetical protein